MKLRTLDDLEKVLQGKYAEDVRDFPAKFAKLIPRSAPTDQAVQVQAAVKQLTGCDCSSDLIGMMTRWDFTHLNVAGFSFGYQKTFAERLIENNRSDALDTWWEDAFEQRPPTHLFIAQSDPYGLVMNVQSDAVLAYVASDGAGTAVKVAHGLSMCLRMLLTVQLFSLGDLGSPAVDDIKGALGQDCDAQFWSTQIQHWAEFN